MNNKGFTLVELLITITILGIVLAFSIAIINNLTTKNKNQSYQIYADSLLQSSKVYNDSYSEDTFANREYGCTKVAYSSLKNKDLISDITLKGAKCGYMVGTNKDSSGVVIRKVKNKYYYETFLYCKDEGAETNKDKDYVKGGVKEYFSDLGDEYCNTKATTDNEEPIVQYRNNNPRHGHFYNKDNRPQPQVKISDSGVGLNNILDINYAWDSKSPTIELLRFTTRKGAGTTRWKDIPLSPDLSSNRNYTEKINVTVKNVEDLAKNVHDNLKIDEDVTTINGVAYKDSVTNTTGTFYVDNTPPTVKVTNQVKWRRTPFNITMTVEDPKKGGIRSGIKYVKYELTNKYARPGNAQTIEITTDKDGERPGNNSNGNNDYARGGTPATGHKDFQRTIEINEPGNYSLKVYVEDWSVNKTTIEYINQYQFDNIRPDCGAASTNNSTAWINRNRNVTIGCSDQENLSGCKQDRYSKTFGESYTGTITIKDNAGNSTTCPVVTRVDKTKPSCTSKGGSSTWRTAALTIYGDCTDQGSVQSGCRLRTYSKVYSGNVKTTRGYGGTAYDNAGNSRDCTKNQTVHIDNEPPTCNGVNKTTTYSKHGVSGRVKCKDSYSGCQSSSYSFSRIKSGRNITIKDNVGHSTNCWVGVSSTTCGSGACISWGYHKSECFPHDEGGHNSQAGCTQMEGGYWVYFSSSNENRCCPASARYCEAYDRYTCYY